MRFKEKPEDFYVEEILKENIIKEKGKYSIYKILKINMTTHEALQKISDYFKINPNLINFCGLKDKRSISIQYFSLPSYINKDFEMGNLKGNFIGYSNFFCNPSLIKFNFFKVLLKDIKFKEEILKRIEEIKIYGLPNYFDHQRFEHAIRYGKFIFEEILKGNYEEALKIYFLTLPETGRKRLRKFKKIVNKYFGDWNRILKYAEKEEEKRILKFLIKNKDTYGAIFEIGEEKLKFYCESYQSFLWNKTLYYFLKSLGLKGYRLRHFLNPFFFYLNIDENLKERLIKKNFPLPHPDEKEGDEEFLRIMKNIKKVKYLINAKNFKNYMIKSKRRGIFIPENLKYEFKNDSILISFYLPPGSYATIFLKSLIAYENIFKL